MAEARSVIDLYYLQKRGVHLGPDYEGYYHVTIRVPSLPVLVSQGSNFARRLKYAMMRSLWPATPATLLAVMGGVTYLTVNAQSDSWVRSGWLAELLWDIDSRVGQYFPFHSSFPTSFRVGYLAAEASFVGMLGIVSIERFLLKGLLTWQGWLYGAKSTLGKIMLTAWGAGVKLLTGRKNLTYAYDSSLPTLPLPSLKDTCDKWLMSVRPLLSEEEFKQAVELSKNFMNNEGKRFQRYLWLKHLFSRNYVLEWWEKYIYLYGRTPIAINSNYYVLDSRERPTLDQCQRAAGIVHHFLRFKDLIESETLEPMTIRGMIPLCMRQYERMFGTTRIPGRECDVLMHTPYARHIVVVSRGHYYKLDVYHGARGTALKPYSVEEIEQQLHLILEHSKSSKSNLPTRKPSLSSLRSSRIQSFEDLVVLESMREMQGQRRGLSSSSSMASFQAALKGNASGSSDRVPRRGTNIGAFTSGPRSRWAEVREKYFSEGVNKKSLHAIESAAFVLFLEDTHFASLNERARSLFHGTGSNRWFDKSINLIVYEDGYAGLNCEHSWADAPAIAHLYEFALLSEWIDYQKKKAKHSPQDSQNGDISTPLNKDSKPSTVVSKKLPVPKRLLWEIDDELQVAIDQAHAFAADMINDVDLRVVEHLEYGKGFIKKNGMSPDGFVQMALQLAYYRNQGKFDLTYESSMTRLFGGGRTETTRTLCAESCAFVEAIESGAPKEEIIKKLKTATNNHANKNRDMMVGKGIDRHLFALYIVSKGLDQSSEFLNQALSMPWRLSTSQQPQDQTTLRDELPPEVASKFMSPGGGFGPVADDGYGVSYMFAGEDQFFFHISSKHSAPNTSSEAFADDIMKALEDMSSLFK